MKLAVFSTKPYDKHYFEMYREGYKVDFTFYEAALDATTANLAEGFDSVCVFVNDIIDEKTINILAFHGIQLIALRCAGYNNVAIDCAKNHSIKVVRVPAYSPDAVAEHAIALILTLNRKTHKAYNRVRESNFSLNNLIGFNLHGKTVGIIGTGKIGATFCKVIQGFGCKVVAYDTYESVDLKTTGVAYKTLEEVFNVSDIISLHCPLLPETKHLINKKTLEQMKDGVMIINTSRGALINTADAIDALSQRKIGYLGIDVYEQEENIFFKDLSESIIQDDMILRLMSFPNVLITSHQAYFTKEAMKEITITTLENLKEFTDGKELTNQVFE
jgi:D-lactate dehydrogenase